MTQGNGTPGFVKYFARMFFSEPEVGSQRIYNAGFNERFSAENGVYISGDKVIAIKHGMSVQDRELLLAGIHD